MSVCQIAHIDKNPLTKSSRIDYKQKKETQIINTYSELISRNINNANNNIIKDSSSINISQIRIGSDIDVITPDAEDENFSDKSSNYKYKVEPSNFYTDDK